MWNYRVIKKKDVYGLYEVFYNDSGDICAHSEHPDITGESVKDIKNTLELMTGDVKKKNKILKWGKIKFASFVNEDEELIEIKDLDDFIKQTDSIEHPVRNLHKQI